MFLEIRRDIVCLASPFHNNIVMSKKKVLLQTTFVGHVKGVEEQVYRYFCLFYDFIWILIIVV